MRLHRFLRPSAVSAALFALLALLPGCVDPNEAGGATAGTALYAFDTADAATRRVLIWDNLTEFFDATETPANSRTISSAQFDKVKNLAWGGLVVDGNGNRLWMVSETGDVVRVERLHNQTGAIPTSEALHFKLGASSSDRLSNGKFSQAAVDPSSGTLYVMETSDSEARIWVVTSPHLLPDGFQVPSGTLLRAPGDKIGTGLAVGSGTVYAYFQDGNQVVVSLTETYNGARLRAGNANGFQNQNVLIGGNARLGKYGSLAVDTGNNRLYFARHNQDAQSTEAPISVFTFGQFGSNPNQAPEKGTLGTADLNNLRVLAHPGNKDWLAALDSASGEAPTNVIRLFKNPSQTVPQLKSRTLGATVKLKGIALDGNA